MKRYSISLCLVFLLALAGCEPDVTDPTSSGQSGSDSTTVVTPTDSTTTVDPDTTQTFTEGLSIVWSGSTATVSGNVEGVSVTSNSNGYVVITSTVKSVRYTLSGSGNGQFKLYSDYKYELLLSDLTLVCSDGPAINSQCKKSGYISLSGTNSLTDGSTYATSDEDQKAALFSEGQLFFSGAGSLTIKGNSKHAIASDDYIYFQSGLGTLNLTAASDGIHANDGIYFQGGTFSISAGEDGVQCDSIITVNDGAITVTKAGDKGIVCDYDLTVTGGTIRISSDYKCIKTLTNLAISGGDIQVICNGTSSGGGGRGGWGSSSDNSSPEGIEAKGTITITGGYVYAQANDDAINSGGDFTISGGCVCAYSTGNDGLDANGNCYIKGGLVYAIGASSPEVAIDANSEERKQLYVQGGTLVAVGGLESGASLTQTCYQASGSANTWYALVVGNDTFAFKTPSSNASTLVVSGASQPALYKSVTPSGTAIFNNMAYFPASYSGGSSVSLSTYSGNSGGGPGGGGGGPGGGGGGGGRPGGW